MKEIKFYRKSILGIRFSIGFRPALALRLVRHDESGSLRIGLLFADLFISSDRWAWDSPGMNDLDYGFSFHHGAFYTNWGLDDSTTLRAFYPYGQWQHRNDLHVKAARGEHPYTYRWQFKPTEVQQVTAKVEEYSQVWQWRVWGLSLPIFKKQRGVWCDFSEELGNGKNDWKGGTIGAGFQIKPGQTWADAYKEMQVKQTFCRAKWA